MPKTFRIKTTPGKDQNLHVPIEQDFDQLEILSLKLTQDDVYSKMCADYGVIIGRVLANGGFGIPNAKVSVYIPLDDIDETHPILSEKYPFKSIEDVTNDGIRYNLLPREKQHCGHTPVGTFPAIEEVLVNDQELDVYKKYYKFTVKTNDSGDYMIWGAPLGQYNVHMDLDLSDMGCYSLTPMDFILQGVPVEEFVSETTYAANENLDKLPQIIKQRKAVEIVPFWGDDELCSIGITRVDYDLRESGVEITPHAVFLGSSFTDAGSRAMTKRCRPRLKQGVLCELKSVPGTIDAIRFTHEKDDNNDPVLEKWYAPSTEQPGDGGAWLVHLPMNLDYVTTDEFGNQVISQDPSEGVATSGKYRMRASPINEAGSGRQRLVASYLIPNIRQMARKNNATESYFWDEPSYAFSVDWRDYEYPSNGPVPFGSNYTAIKDMAIACEDYFFHYKANRVYTVSSFIDKIKKTQHRRGFLGIKNIEPTDDAGCGGSANYFPITSAYKVINFMIVLMQIITRVQEIVYKIFIGIIGVIILPFERLGNWQVFKGRPFRWLIRLVVCPLKRAGRIELEAVAYPTCEKCACDEEDPDTFVPPSTTGASYGPLSGSIQDPYNDPPLCNVTWWYGGQAGTFYITSMSCLSSLINPDPAGDNMGGLWSTVPKVEDIQQTSSANAYQNGGVPQGLGFRITSVDVGAGNITPTSSNTYLGTTDFPSWCNSGNGPCPNPPNNWNSRITYAGLGTADQPADPNTCFTGATATVSAVEGADATQLEPLYEQVGLAMACAGTTGFPPAGCNVINLCGSLFRASAGATFSPPADGMCNAQLITSGGFVYAGDGAGGPYNTTNQFFETPYGTAPYSYAAVTGQGAAGPGGIDICQSTTIYPTPFYIVTESSWPGPGGGFIEAGMNPDTAGSGQFVMHATGINVTIQNPGSSSGQILADNSDDCDVYDNFYGGSSCDCANVNSNCETICGIGCENGQCSQGPCGSCEKSCFGDPGCPDCLTTNVCGGCYVIYPGAALSKNNRLIAEWRNVTNLNSALCNGLMGYFFSNTWINGTLYHFQFKGKEKGSFWSGPGCRATSGGVVKFQQREGVSAAGKWGSGANRKKWYYRSTMFDVATVGTTNNGFFFGGGLDTTGDGMNENYIKFPTTVMDMGPRVNWLKTICANPDLDSECFTAGDIGASTHQNASAVLQAAVNQRLEEGCGDGTLAEVFFNRERMRVDGDIAQLLTEQTTVGTQEFDLFDPDYGPTENDVIMNLGIEGPPTKISFILEETGANTRSCLSTPRDLYDWDPLELRWVPENLGKQTQIVPFYPWDRWDNGGCGWTTYTLQWGGCGPQNNGTEWNRGVSQDWWTADDNSGYLYSDFYQGLGNNYSGNLTNFGPGTGAGVNLAGNQTFRQDSPGPTFFSGNTNYPDLTFMVLGAPMQFYMGLIPGDNAYSYFLQKYIKLDEDCNPDEFI